MRREQYLVDPVGKISVQLPVPPKEYWVEKARTIDFVEMQEVGQVDIPGGSKLFDRDIECMFPAQGYPFLSSEAVTSPKYYIDIINGWIETETVVRYIIPGTDVNVPVRIGGIRYGEKDGTNDIYATINIREHKELIAVSTVKTAAENSPRAAAASSAETTYTAIYGDTFWSIAQKFYGDGSLCYKLAAYNGVANANIIKVGQVIKIPDIAKLRSIKTAAAAVSPKQAAEKKTPENVKIIVKGDKEYFGIVTLKVIKPDGNWYSTVSVRKPKTVTVPFNSMVDISVCGDRGHSWTYIKLGTKKISGFLRVSHAIREDTELYVNWVR